jgi:enoyl-CoA hydratase
VGVRAERSGRVTTVILDRPEVRNAVDGPTAAALADAFRAFDSDEAADVAVLWVDRVVPAGEARAAAERLARELAALPQACLRSDRAAVLDGTGLPDAAALAAEFRHGRQVLSAPGFAEGVRRFRDGAGRGGAPV